MFVKRFQFMDNSSGSDLDLDIDLESGGGIWEDTRIENDMGDQNTKTLIGRMRCGIHREEASRGSTCNGGCSCSSEKKLKFDEISSKDTDSQSSTLRKDMASEVNKSKDLEKSRKHNYAKPPKPPRHPRGPSDVKLLKEISEINLKRKGIERLRTLKKMKKEKGSSLSSNLLALLVTIIFLLVIFLQGTNFSKLKP